MSTVNHNSLVRYKMLSDICVRVCGCCYLSEAAAVTTRYFQCLLCCFCFGFLCFMSYYMYTAAVVVLILIDFVTSLLIYVRVSCCVNINFDLQECT